MSHSDKPGMVIPQTKMSQNNISRHLLAQRETLEQGAIVNNANNINKVQS